MFTTPLCRSLGIAHPVFCAGIGAAAGAELVAAVSGAGGCGVLGTAGLPGKFVCEQIRQVKGQTVNPFGVNIVLPLLRKGQIEACFDERVPIVVFFWGDCAPYAERARQLGIKVFVQVGSVAEAMRAAEAGADAVIAQGFEAGGHVKGTTSLSVLLPAVVDAVRPLPVLASGGIADGRGLIAALALGGQAISIGTRFLASREANAAAAYKERVVSATAEDTVHVEHFDVGWPQAAHRVLRNAAVHRLESGERLRSGERPGEGGFVGRMSSGGATIDIPAYSAYVAERGAVADIDEMALYAGESCTLIDEIKPAAEIVSDILRDASETMTRLSSWA